MQPSSTAPIGAPPSVQRGRPDLRLVPHSVPPRRSRFGVLVTLVAIVAMVASGTAVYLWQHGQLTNGQVDVTRLQDQLTTAQGQLTTAEAQLTTARDRLGVSLQQVAALRGTVSGLRLEVVRLGDELSIVTARRDALAELLSKARAGKKDLAHQLQALTVERDKLASSLANTEDQLATAQADLQAVEARLLTLAGPPLADGRYTGRVFAAANSNPPRLAINEASTIDGEAVAIRGWRVLEVAPGTMVMLITWRDTGSHLVPFSWFAHVFNSADPLDSTVRGGTQYWITLTDGRVVAIGEYQA